MNLIPCPACEHRVSSEAPFCPGCGHPLLATSTEPAESLTAAPNPASEAVCDKCSAPATQKCCDCGSLCCLHHANFIRSKRGSAFYCNSCAEAKRNADAAALVFALIALIVILMVAASSG